MIGGRVAIRLAVAVALMVAWGCKPREDRMGASAAAVPPEEVAAMRDGLARGMQTIRFAGLTESHAGRSCVVVARTPEQHGPVGPPPPLGMVYHLGSTTIYKGYVHAVSSEELQIQAPYPGSGNLKIVKVPQADIQSIHLGK